MQLTNQIAAFIATPPYLVQREAILKHWATLLLQVGLVVSSVSTKLSMNRLCFCSGSMRFENFSVGTGQHNASRVKWIAAHNFNQFILRQFQRQSRSSVEIVTSTQRKCGHLHTVRHTGPELATDRRSDELTRQRREFNMDAGIRTKKAKNAMANGTNGTTDGVSNILSQLLFCYFVRKSCRRKCGVINCVVMEFY